METRLAALLASEVPGISVVEVCAELGISRSTFYELRARFAREGPDGLKPRSRRPHRSPNATPAWLEEEICRLRKELAIDNGADVIGWHLRRRGIDPPSDRTIHRVLVRRGMVAPQPHKRPKSSWRRFEFEAPNACWQIDATEWPMAGGATAWIMDVLDDHSRLVSAAEVGSGPTAALAVKTMQVAAGRWGLPTMVLSDNGTCFTGGRLVENEGAFGAALGALGVRAVRSRPYHPQTCGKIERFHQTLKRWLATQPLASSPRQLQAQLDRYLEHYNHRRPHRALRARGHTPAAAWEATPRHGPADEALPVPAVAAVGSHLVNDRGAIGIDHHFTTSVGTEWTGQRLTVIRYGTKVAILDGHELVARLTLDPTRNYQPSGRKRGGPRRRPI
jgi:transposase InsO family protein